MFSGDKIALRTRGLRMRGLRGRMRFWGKGFLWNECVGFGKRTSARKDVCCACHGDHAKA